MHGFQFLIGFKVLLSKEMATETIYYRSEFGTATRPFLRATIPSVSIGMKNPAISPQR